ncbi:hypothetical protein QOT17_001382 [Balamuthia mandrillaris]
MEAKRMGEGEAMPPPPPPPPLAATSSMTEVTSTLTTSSIQALEATEKKIIRLMEVAAQATAALSTMDATIENKRQVIASLNDYFALVQVPSSPSLSSLSLSLSFFSSFFFGFFCCAVVGSAQRVKVSCNHPASSPPLRQHVLPRQERL